MTTCCKGISTKPHSNIRFDIQFHKFMNARKKKTKKHLDIITVYHTFATQIRLLGRDES